MKSDIKYNIYTGMELWKIKHNHTWVLFSIKLHQQYIAEYQNLRRIKMLECYLLLFIVWHVGR